MPCTIRLSANRAVSDTRGFITTSMDIGGVTPTMLLTIERATQIPDAIENFGKAVAILFGEDASFSLSCWKHDDGMRAVPRLKATLDDPAVRALQHRYVKPTQAPRSIFETRAEHGGSYSDPGAIEDHVVAAYARGIIETMRGIHLREKIRRREAATGAPA